MTHRELRSRHCSSFQPCHSVAFRVCGLLRPPPKTFSRIHHVLGRKMSLSKENQDHMKPFFFPEHPGMYQQINHEENWKSHRHVKMTRCATEQSTGPQNKAKGKILPCLERNEIITRNNLWDATKALPGCKFAVIRACLKQNQSRTT